MSKVRGGGMTGGLLRPSKLGAFNNQGDDNTEEQVSFNTTNNPADC